jgi:hypothetical protein
VFLCIPEVQPSHIGKRLHTTNNNLRDGFQFALAARESLDYIVHIERKLTMHFRWCYVGTSGENSKTGVDNSECRALSYHYFFALPVQGAHATHFPYYYYMYLDLPFLVPRSVVWF